MKRFFMILFLILALGLAPAISIAQQQTPNTPDQKAAVKPDDGAAKPGGGCPGCPHKGKMMGSEDWKAKHEKMKQEVEAMDKRLDEAVAAMNAATGDQKIAAMANVINELVAQRKHMMGMFKTFHGKMGMMGPCPGCKMGKDMKGKHRHHGE
ncbi:MAG: hypothetical protein ABFD97_22755 [Syntrophobacter sp.]